MSHLPRVIPCLLLRGKGLVKTIKFQNPTYVGDPINAVKIFNEKEVDELLFLDITASRENREPNFKVIEEIASECFMPVGYGGGVCTIEQIKNIFSLGIEKVSLNTAAAERPEFIREAASVFGSQSIVVAIDVKRDVFGKYRVMIQSGTKNTKRDPVEYAQEVERMGAGEVLLNSIDRDGTMRGYDTVLLKKVTAALSIPVIACGGAGALENLRTAITEGGASAVSAGSIFVFQGEHRAVLISYPEREELKQLFV